MHFATHGGNNLKALVIKKTNIKFFGLTVTYRHHSVKNVKPPPPPSSTIKELLSTVTEI